MELDRTIRKMMLSIRVEKELPDQYFYYIRTKLEQMYVAGWEEGQLEINQHGNKPIGQFDKTGTSLINPFKSLKDAAKKTGFSVKGIAKCMNRKTPMKQGWMWRYLKEEEIPIEMKKPVPKKNWLI